MSKCGNAFSRVIQKYTKFAIFTLLYFRYFTTKLYSFTKFRKLFPTVLKSFSNLKVCLIGEWSIVSFTSLVIFNIILAALFCSF